MATVARINRRRIQKRNGHSVKCWNSKWDMCSCSKSPNRRKSTF